MKELTVDARVENLEALTDFVNEELDAMGCPMRAKFQIAVAVDEIFSNICHYAYGPGGGRATVRVEGEREPSAVCISFCDMGRPYDPLKAQDPDVSLPAEDRAIGGLGVYMVKKTMDEVYYVRENDCNILTIKKLI